MTEPTGPELADFVYREARLLDTGRYDEWLDLFAEDGLYWVPLVPGQVDGINHSSLAYEDKLLLRLRIERLRDPGPFSQHPRSRCHHLLQRPEIESADPAGNSYVVRTQFHYTETRADEQLHPRRHRVPPPGRPRRAYQDRRKARRHPQLRRGLAVHSAFFVRPRASVLAIRGRSTAQSSSGRNRKLLM